MMSFMSMAVVSVVWVLWGYSIAFGEGKRLSSGDLSLIGLSDVARVNEESPGDGRHAVRNVFQMMFAIITPALITGAMVERFKFTTYLVFLGRSG